MTEQKRVPSVLVEVIDGDLSVSTNLPQQQLALLLAEAVTSVIRESIPKPVIAEEVVEELEEAVE